MKTIIALGFTILLTFSSSFQKDEFSNHVTISGKIENHQDKGLKIADFLGKAAWEKTISLEENAFNVQLNLEKPAIQMLIYGKLRKDIFLQPGKSLEVFFDASNIESTYSYSGELALENELLDSISSRMDSIDRKFAYGQPLDKAALYLDSLNKDDRQYLQQLLKNNKTADDFAYYAKGFIDYNYAFLKFIIADRKEEQPDGFYDFVHELELEDPDLLDIPHYRLFLYYYIEWQAKKKMPSSGADTKSSRHHLFSKKHEVIAQMKNDDIKAYSLYNAMVEWLMENGVKDFEKHYDYFKKHNKDAHYAEQLQMVYEEKKQIAPGQRAPHFTLTDVDGREVSLKDFEGKYVYLDFWQTRCPRSVRELPHYLELYDEYADENIAFVSISVDENKDFWKAYVKENRNVGASLRTERVWDAEVYKAYQLYGLPSFVLIDPEGLIIDPVAPKPSSEEIRPLLNDLLRD